MTNAAARIKVNNNNRVIYTPNQYAAVGTFNDDITTTLVDGTLNTVNERIYRNVGVPIEFLNGTGTWGTATTSAITVNNNAYIDGLTITNATTAATNSITVDTTNLQDIIWNGNEIKIVYNTAYDYIESAKDAVKNAIKKNISGFPSILKNRSLPSTISPEEQKARDTLRDMISEAQYRRYITNGFIMVRGPKSGHFYQVFMNSGYDRIRVYENGKHLRSICIHTVKDCPPTDHVINMKIMIECDEDSFIKSGNIHQIGSNIRAAVAAANEQRSLVDIYKRSKELENKKSPSYRPDELVALAV